jgi:hypothetical protein
MRATLMFACAALAVTPVFAQDNEAPEGSRRPLADVADLEPAVDVSRSEAIAPPRASPPAGEAPAVVARAGNRGTDSLDLGTTSITGNQELPKVLYIVPWKRSDLGDHVGRPVNTLLDEVLEPIDPEVFERHLDYYETLHGVSPEE